MAMQSGFIKRIRDIMRMDAGINGDAQRIEQMVWMLFLKVYDAKEDDWELNEDNYESIIPEELRWRNWAKATQLPRSAIPIIRPSPRLSRQLIMLPSPG